MKRIFVAAILAGVLVAAGAFVASKTPLTKATATVRADGGAPCSLATVAGSSGFTISGTLIFPTGPVPVAAIGKDTIGADGSFSGTETRSLGGSVAQETLKGTVTVSPDCTGKLTAQALDESGKLVRTSVFAFVIDDNSSEIRALQTSLVLPDGTNVPNVITVEARKIGPAGGE